MKIVLDTNVLLSGIFWKGIPGEILDLWVSESIQIVATEEILREYIEVIQRFSSKARAGIGSQWAIYLIENIQIIGSTSELKVCRDPDDNKFINCALDADARYIVSGDDDLLTLKEVNGVTIITPSAFLKSIAGSKPGGA